MISLRKYLEQEPDKRFAIALTAFTRTLHALGIESQQSCPLTAAELTEALETLISRLLPEITASALLRAGKEAEQHVHRWGAASGEYFKQKTGEIREMLLLLAHASDAVGERDERYASRFGEMTQRLQTISRLDDLTQMRSSLVSGAAELKACVEGMVEEGRNSVAQLRAEVSSYQARLEEAENEASRDSLTGVYNRRRLEATMNSRIAEQRCFSIIMLDLDDFKAVNEEFGRLAGDNLLKQFAYELRCSAHSDAIVGRWGGDAFVVILDSSLDDATAMMDRMQHWFNGAYSLPDTTGACKINLRAAMGVVQWQPGQTIEQLISRADHALHEQRRLTRAR